MLSSLWYSVPFRPSVQSRVTNDWIEHLRCFIMGHRPLWTLHWVNFCIIQANFTQFSLKMNYFGTSHSQISPVNLVSKCSQVYTLWTLGWNGTVFYTRWHFFLWTPLSAWQFPSQNQFFPETGTFLIHVKWCHAIKSTIANQHPNEQQENNK